MTRDRDEGETWRVEVLPAPRRGGAPPPGSRLLATAALVAAVAAGVAVLALIAVFAATVALIAVPVAVGAGLVAWAAAKWRAFRARDGR